MTREAVVEAIMIAAAQNSGRPLGARAFHASSGISRTDLWNAGFARYSDAVREAGLVPNQLQMALDSAEMLSSLACLVRRLGRFPSISDLKAGRSSDPDLPSYEAYFRLAGGSIAKLPDLLEAHCREREELSDVRQILATVPQISAKPQSALSRKRVQGYVYLAKHGRHYKIGRSNDVARRRREIALLLPQALEHIHVIETDDPEGIEQYWHRRFESRRQRGEWFRLSPDDIAAFKRRQYQ